jgi:hypothetical protein
MRKNASLKHGDALGDMDAGANAEKTDDADKLD